MPQKASQATIHLCAINLAAVEGSVVLVFTKLKKKIIKAMEYKC